MNFISYGGKVYVTDGFTKRHVPSPTVLDDLRAAAGNPPIEAVSKATADFLRNTELRDVMGELSQVKALVEQVQRIIIDLHR